MSTVATRAHAHAVRGDDFYPTATEAVTALLRIEPNLPDSIWEPACGDGAIVLPLRASGRYVAASDLVDRGCPLSVPGLDFLAIRTGRPFDGGIVTNPPFKLARRFVETALGVAPYVAMLLRLNFLEGVERRRWLESTPLARIHVSSRRLPMMHRHGWDGPKSTSAVCYAWFIWEAGHTGAPIIKWFDWKEVGE